MSSHSRRLPIYLLLDCSESMAGEAIADLERGVETMVTLLRDDPLALESAWVSVITFARDARQILPLTEILQFQCPRLSVRSGTAMGAALKLLIQCLRREVVRTTPTTKGDYKPLVFLFTDGQPTDAWESAADEIRRQDGSPSAQITAIACGPDVETEALDRVTDVVLRMKDTTPQTWRKVFLWLSASVKSVQSTSVAPGAGGLVGGLAEKALSYVQRAGLMPLPADALEVAVPQPGASDPRPRQVFLHAFCSKNGRPYLMRLARRPQGETYVPVSSHPLDALDEGGGQELPPINTSLLEGFPGCPYCENSGVIQCDCHALFCGDAAPDSVIACPSCKRQGKIAGDREPNGIVLPRRPG